MNLLDSYLFKSKSEITVLTMDANRKSEFLKNTVIIVNNFLSLELDLSRLSLELRLQRDQTVNHYLVVK